jgi:CDP-paratose 2-epimerase
VSVVIVTGSSGLIGSESTRHFARKGMDVVGIDNDLRKYFFGAEASTSWQRDALSAELGKSYTHVEQDIRNFDQLEALFKRYGSAIQVVIHTAAQPSHDWAAREPLTDFGVNAVGTLNLLEATRKHAPNSVFIFTSTNKVYGDTPNLLPLVEQELRWEIEKKHAFFGGIPEQMSIDSSTHSVFGASKVAADVMVQEYGRYFGMNTACFRGGCLTGPNHSGAQLHGFLAYLVQCAATGRKYSIFGYKGKQVRDNIHSRDLINAFENFVNAPRQGEVYNIGGGRESNCSVLEAIKICEEVIGKPMNYSYVEDNRIGDHIWYISALQKFKSHYPNWQITRNVKDIISEIYENNRERWAHISAKGCQ